VGRGYSGNDIIVTIVVVDHVTSFAYLHNQCDHVYYNSDCAYTFIDIFDKESYDCGLRILYVPRIDAPERAKHTNSVI